MISFIHTHTHTHTDQIYIYIYQDFIIMIEKTRLKKEDKL